MTGRIVPDPTPKVDDPLAESRAVPAAPDGVLVVVTYGQSNVLVGADGEVSTHLVSATYAAENPGGPLRLINSGEEDRPGLPNGHTRDRMGICTRCGHGLTALEILDGEEPCDADG